jgi:hypothetical protein
MYDATLGRPALFFSFPRCEPIAKLQISSRTMVKPQVICMQFFVKIEGRGSTDTLGQRRYTEMQVKSELQFFQRFLFT